jgi:sugar phosphate isomerase/epimerase
MTGGNVPTFSSSTSLFHATPIEQAAERLAACGFTEIEIFDGAQTDDWLDDPARTARTLQANGLRVRTVHLPVIGWEIDSPDEALRQLALQACVRAMRIAAQLGAEAAIVHPNGAHLAFTADGYGLSWHRTRQSLVWLAARAGEIGIKLAAENLPAHGTWRPGMYVSELLCMIDGLGEHVGICLDAGHSTCNHIGAGVEARLAGAKLFALHIQDNDGSGADQHLLPGRGVTDWDDFRRALDEIGFQGARTFEVGRGENLDNTLQALAALRHEWGG